MFVGAALGVWLVVAVLGLGMTLGYDQTTVERYASNGNLTAFAPALQYGWPWTYAITALFETSWQRWFFWQKPEACFWFSWPALLGDAVLGLLGVGGWGWLVLRWYVGGKPWQVGLKGFLLLWGVVALVFAPFASVWQTSYQAQQVVEYLAEVEQKDTSKIRRLLAEYPFLHRGQQYRLETSVYALYEVRFFWLWDLLGVEPPRGSQVPWALYISTANVPRALAAASKLPTLHTLLVSSVFDPRLMEERFDFTRAGKTVGRSQVALTAGETPVSAEAGASTEWGAPLQDPVQYIFQGHDFWKPGVDVASLRRLQRLPRLKCLYLSVYGAWSDQCVAALVRCSSLVLLELEDPYQSRSALSEEQLRLWRDHPSLKSLSIDTVFSTQTREELRRRGIHIYCVHAPPSSTPRNDTRQAPPDDPTRLSGQTGRFAADRPDARRPSAEKTKSQSDCTTRSEP